MTIAQPVADQEHLIEDLLACTGAASQREFVRRHARSWRHESVMLLKGRCDHLMGSLPRRAWRAAHMARLVALEVGSSAALALADRALAQACHVVGHYGFALALYERAAAGADGAGDAAQAGGSRAAMVDALMHLGRHEEALALAARTRPVLEELGERRRVAVLDANVANGMLLLDRPADALAGYERAAAEFGRLGDALGAAKADVGRANALGAMNDPLGAAATLEEVTHTFEALGLTALAGQTRYNLAYMQLRLGRYAEALAGFEQAESIFTALDDRQYLALCALDQAELQLICCQAEESSALASRAYTSLLRFGRRNEAGRALVLLARAHLQRGRLAEAQDAIEDARALFVGLGNHAQAAATGLVIAELLLRRGEPEAALGACVAVLAAQGAGYVTAVAAECHLLRARALHALRRPGVYSATTRAISAARATYAPWLIWQARYLQARLRDEAGDHITAARRYAQAVASMERQRGAIPTAELRASFQEDKAHLFEDMVRNSLRRGQIEEAFSLADRARSRTLADILAQEPLVPRHLPGAGDALRGSIEHLREQLSWLYSRLYDDPAATDGAPRSRARGAVERYERDLNRLLARLRAQQATRLPLQDVEGVSLSMIQSLLPPATTVIEYFVAGADAYAFAVTASGITVHRLAGAIPPTLALLRRWRLYIGKFSYDGSFALRHAEALATTARHILAGLHTLLIAPLDDQLGDGDLIVIPHAALHGVPFQALHDGHRHLIERRALSYAPSAAVLRHCLERRAGGASGRPLIVGVPDERAPAIDAEVSAVAGLLESSAVVSGMAATADTFRRLASQASILHIAAHAVFRRDNPAFSALRLADRWLTLHEVYELDLLCAQLVTLSGCATGTASAMAGDELIGLVRGFLYAGAPAVLASRWSIDDATAVAFMGKFYGALLEQGGTNQALRRAQVQLIRDGAQPFHWAPFTLVGRP